MKPDLTDIFYSLTGHPQPLPWQQRLYGLMSTGKVPSALDIPTGLGKTSVMALWLAARSAGADLPRRLVYVVDRRAIVDQATEEAGRLARAWQELTGEALPVSTLRGQHADNRAWMDDPTGPAIIVGTVDMIGSRLLFQGYGVSRGMRPYQAGLLGCDALVVLDEAHLCRPFQAMLRRAEAGADLRQRGGVPPIVPGLTLLCLSATGDTGPDSFTLSPGDEEDAATRQRLRAGKSLILTEAMGGLETALATVTQDLAASIVTPCAPAPPRIAVFCTSREVAQKVLDQLEKAKPAVSTLALVGQRRVFEREAVASDLRKFGFLPPSAGEQVPAPPDRPVILVATAAGEVGVDLDADHAVMDLVAAERMIQRLGRVNRRGRPGHTARITVIDGPWKGEPEEMARLRTNARQVLEKLPAAPDGGGLDACPAALLTLKASHGPLLTAASTPPPLHPVLDRSALDAWAMTSLTDHPGRPDPQPWLRGWVAEEEPEMALVWRAHLPWPPGRATPPDPALVTAWAEAAPPHLLERLDAPVSQVLKLLVQRLDRCGLPPETPAALLLTAGNELVPDAAWTVRNLADLLGNDRARRGLPVEWAGRTLILSARLGGIDDAGLLNDRARGWRGPDSPAATLSRGNEIAWPGCLDAPGDGPGNLAGESADTGVDPPLTAMADRIGITVQQARVSEDAPPLPPGWIEVARLALEEEEEGAVRPGAALRVLARRDGTRGARGDRAVAPVPQELAPHLADVVAEVERLARRLALPPELTRTLCAAAALHDLGKARARWQQAMGVSRAAIRAGIAYAKTGGTGGNWRLLDGYRHEFGSLFDAEEAQHSRHLDGLPERLRDLALHLVAAHHGHARPLIAPQDPARSLAEATAKARDVALRFVILQADWGPWGLAWWEALLRAADAEASRRRERPGPDASAGEGR